MGVLVLNREAKQERGLRPLDILRDLSGISQLVGSVFADDITREGAQIERDLFLLTLTSPFLWVLGRISTDIRDAFDGFVWIEGGRIVGNVTLTRDDPGRRVWSITNVAVHPAYRRRGIARTLMVAALDAVRQRGGGPVTLEVRADNAAAYSLYQSMGFRFVDGVVNATYGGRLARTLPQATQARRVHPAEEHALYELMLAIRSADSLLLSPLREDAYCRPLLRRVADQVRDLLWQEQRFWLGVDEVGIFSAAAHVHLRAFGSSFARVYIHPQARGRAEEAIIQGALHACGSSSLSVTIQVVA